MCEKRKKFFAPVNGVGQIEKQEENEKLCVSGKTGSPCFRKCNPKKIALWIYVESDHLMKSQDRFSCFSALKVVSPHGLWTFFAKLDHFLLHFERFFFYSLCNRSRAYGVFRGGCSGNYGRHKCSLSFLIQ